MSKSVHEQGVEDQMIEDQIEDAPNLNANGVPKGLRPDGSYDATVGTDNDKDADKGKNKVPEFKNDEEAVAWAKAQQEKLYKRKVKDGTVTEADRVAAS